MEELSDDYSKLEGDFAERMLLSRRGGWPDGGMNVQRVSVSGTWLF